MRLLLLMSLGSPWSRQIALALTSLGHEVVVVDFERPRAVDHYVHTLTRTQSEPVAAFRRQVSAVHLLPTRFGSALRYVTCAARLRRLCAQQRVDGTLALYGGGWATSAWLSGLRPYSVYVVGSDALFPGRIAKRLLPCTLGSAALVFANGSYLAQRTQELAPKARIVPLLIGVDTGKFRPPDELLPPAPVRVVCTRGFDPIYNNEFLIQGLAALESVHESPRVTFTSAGSTLESVKALANSSLQPGVAQNVEFRGGVSDGELLAALRQSHLFVSLSKSDGTSISLLEALSCGLFPIVSDIPQNREWVFPEHQNGILVPLDDPLALARALEVAARRPDLRTRAAEFNRRQILERADCARNMALLANKLKETVQKQKTR